MKKIIGALVVTSILFGSCNNEKKGVETAKELMQERYMQQIRFTNKMSLAKPHGKFQFPACFSTPWDTSSKYKVIHYIDADCSSCREELLLIQKKILQFCPKNAVKFVIVSSSLTSSAIEHLMDKNRLQIPIYYDIGYRTFKKINQLPIDDYLYNTMLVSKHNKVVLFGSFFHNEEAEKLFFKIINEGNESAEENHKTNP